MKWDFDKLYEDLCKLMESKPINHHPIKRVIFNAPATIIFWRDGTKTVAKCGPEDYYNKEVGFIVAYLKHFISGTQLQKDLERFVWKK